MAESLGLDPMRTPDHLARWVRSETWHVATEE